MELLKRHPTERWYSEFNKAPNGIELHCDYWSVINKAPGGEEAFKNKTSSDANPKMLLDQRHLVLRKQTAASCMKFRALTLKAFRDYFERKNMVEVTPPLIVQTQAEGGSSVFDLKYYQEKVFLS